MLQIDRRFSLRAFWVCILLASPLMGYYIMDAPLKDFSSADRFDVSLLPAAYAEVAVEYKKGNYRLCILQLNTLLEMALPDGRLDHYLLMAGECYYQLDLGKFASTLFQKLVREYPDSPLHSYALYRLQEDAYSRGDSASAEYYYRLIQSGTAGTDIRRASNFLEGKRLYKAGRVDECDRLLAALPKNTDLYYPALFIRALCSITRNDIERAMLQLDGVLQHAANDGLRDESLILYAELYLKMNRHAQAIALLKTLREDSPKYGRALLLIIQSYLKTGNLDQVVLNGEKLLRLSDVTYLFETAMVLEEAYLKRQENARIDSLRAYVETTVRRKKLVYDLYREIDILSEMEASFSHHYLAFSAGLKERTSRHRAEALFSGLSGDIRDLRDRELRLLKEMDPENIAIHRSGFFEIRYLDFVNRRMEELTRSADTLSDRIRLLSARRDSSLTALEERQLLTERSLLLDSLQSLRELKRDVQVNSLGENAVLRETETLQAKFVDWSLSRLDVMKNRLKEVYRDLSRLDKSPSPEVPSREMLEKEAGFLEARIRLDRDALIGSIRTLVDLSPFGRYTDQFLIRLSELEYERIQIDFETRLDRYEADYKRFEQGELKEEPEYPRYDFTSALLVYKRIVRDFPQSDLSDDVLYLTGLCHKKMDEGEKANKAFEILVAQYPNSEYASDALMEIGNYYFNNPELAQGKGYMKAIDIYKQILKHRESEKFVEALYRLAWSYYMIDKYDEAITVFRHLIEEIDISENYSSDEAKKAQNPLFKAEAIEYIAISLCEVDDLKNARRFLDMIGNNRYSLMVMNRMGVYYEEQLEYERAMECFALAMKKYSDLDAVLDARMGHIRCLERLEQYDKAREEKEDFFRIYGRGAKWQARMSDPAARSRADSLSILCILSVAQAHINSALKGEGEEAYIKTIKAYDALLLVYPDEAGSEEAQWNTALIYEQNLHRYDDARRTYLGVSARKNGKHTEQAAVNAIAMAQQLDEDGRFGADSLSVRDQKVVEACRNYALLFPDSGKVVEVASIAAAIFFNRKFYPKALSAYQKILARCGESTDKLCLDALFFIGQSYSGMNDHFHAEESYAKLYAIAPYGSLKEDAKKRMVESAFQYADNLRQSHEFEKAAQLFLSIEKKYPFYDNLDVVLFNAADAYEKMRQWKRGAEVYRWVADRFPNSKLADGALFNGALCFENDSAYQEAIANYERLLSTYPASPKARDALYNIGLCYEKLKDYDKMAEANERYAEKYPDSKDVEQMLLASGRFFYQSEKLDRALRAFENFVRRFPGSANEIEARYHVGLILFKMGDKSGAESAFQELLRRNQALAAQKTNNDYYAAEALFRLAGMMREKYLAIRFTLPEKNMEKQQEEKADLLKKTVEMYAQVIAIKSEHIFEAAYRIGEAYSHFADIYYAQERNPKNDEAKRLLFERDINLSALDLYEKCVEPHLANVMLAKGIPSDSLKPDQRRFIELSRQALQQTFLRLGGVHERNAELFLQAKVPDKLSKLPIQSYLYRQKIIETVEPFLEQALEEYITLSKKAVEKGLSDSLVIALRDSASRILYQRAALFGDLASEMLDHPAIPEKIKDEAREEIVFQLEDMAFEIQDRALEKFEEGYAFLQKEGIASAYTQKILERLKVMDPQKYTPQEAIRTAILLSDLAWKQCHDPFPGWTRCDKPDSLWLPSTVSGDKPPEFWPQPKASTLTRQMPALYAKRLFYLSGRPNRSQAIIASRGTYRLYVNGVFIATDSGKAHTSLKADTFDVKAYLTGGDNAVSISIRSQDNDCRILFALTVEVDTSMKYQSAIGLPPLWDEESISVSGPVVTAPVPVAAKPLPSSPDSAAVALSPTPVIPVAPAPAPSVRQDVLSKPSSAPVAVDKVADELAAIEKEFKNYSEFKNAINEAVNQEQEVQKEVRNVQARVRGLKYKIDSMNEKIDAVKNDVKVYQKILDSKERRK